MKIADIDLLPLQVAGSAQKRPNDRLSLGCPTPPPKTRHDGPWVQGIRHQVVEHLHAPVGIRLPWPILREGRTTPI